MSKLTFDDVVQIKFFTTDPGLSSKYPDKFGAIIKANVEAKYIKNNEPIVILLRMSMQDTYQECKDWVEKTFIESKEFKKDRDLLDMLQDKLLEQYRYILVGL